MPIYSYGLMLIIAFFTALWIAKKRAPRFGFLPEEIADVSVWTLLVGILGARIVFILLDFSYYASRPQELFSLRFQGLTSFGGLIFGLLFLAIWTQRKRKSLVAMLDLVSGPVLVGFAIGRIGCVLNGCCRGPLCLTQSPLCVPIEGLSGRYQPAQLYDSALNLVGFAVLLALERRGLARGQSLSGFLVLHGASRFIFEVFRAGVSSEVTAFMSLTLAQITALVMIIVGAALFIWFGRRSGVRTEPAHT